MTYDLDAVDVELLNARTTIERLAPLYKTTLEADQMSPTVIGEIANTIRSVRSALDKIANGVHVELLGSRGGRTYFPITTDQARFDALLEKNLPKLRTKFPLAAAAFESCQPFQPGWERLADLPNLYVENAHHGYERHEIHSSALIGIVPGIFELSNRQDDPDEYFEGVPIKTTTFGEDAFAFRTSVTADWYFEETQRSIMGTLIRNLQLAVSAYGKFLITLGRPGTREQGQRLTLSQVDVYTWMGITVAW